MCAYLLVNQMDNEHLALIVYLVNLQPMEVIGLATTLEGQDTKMVYSKIQMVALVVLHTSQDLVLEIYIGDVYNSAANT